MTKMSPPWLTFYHELFELLDGDPDVNLEYLSGDGEDPKIKVFVNGTDKADALERILPKSRSFGNVTVNVEVIPSNDNEETIVDVFLKAFENNPAFSYAVRVDGVTSNAINYVVFRNKVVQFYNDNLGDVNGNCTTLYEDIARDVFDDLHGIFFCTDLPGNIGMPKAVIDSGYKVRD